MGCHPTCTLERSNTPKLNIVVSNNFVTTPELYKLRVREVQDKLNICSKFKSPNNTNKRPCSPVTRQRKHLTVQSSNEMMSYISNRVYAERAYEIKLNDDHISIKMEVTSLLFEQLIPLTAYPDCQLIVEVEGIVYIDGHAVTVGVSQDFYAFNIKLQGEPFESFTSRLEFVSKEKSIPIVTINIFRKFKELQGLVNFKFFNFSSTNITLPEMKFLRYLPDTDEKKALPACRLMFASKDPSLYGDLYLNPKDTQYAQIKEKDPNLIFASELLNECCSVIAKDVSEGKTEKDKIEKKLSSFIKHAFEWKVVKIDLDKLMSGFHAESNRLLENEDVMNLLFDKNMRTFGLLRTSVKFENSFYICLFCSLDIIDLV